MYLNDWFLFTEAVNFVTDRALLRACVLECLWLKLNPIFYPCSYSSTLLHTFNLFQMAICSHLVASLSC